MIRWCIYPGMPPAEIQTPIKDYCLNCDQHKWIRSHATCNNRVGYLCVECYDVNSWAKEDNHQLHTLLKDQ